MNGSGVKGASSKISTVFKEKGYTQLSSGNADNFNYTTTSLQCAKNIDEKICEEIDNMLLENYPNTQKKEDETLKDNAIKIILGKTDQQ